MSSITIGKEINKFFEQVYHLFEDSIMIPEYLNLDDQYIQDTIIKFMDSCKIEGEWDMTDEDRVGFGIVYFEAGYHDSNAVYYPFEDTNDINKFEFNELSDVWESALECIVEKCDNEEQVNEAENLLKQLDDITNKLLC